MKAAPARIDAPLVGALGFLVGVAGAGRPSFWYDEVATVHSATRSPSELWALLANQDAVHGLYYWVMHHWFAVFGVSPLSARVPSALAAGVAAAGVVVLGRRLADRRTGLLAGLVFVVLPAVTWSAVEARSFAGSAAVAVWLTVLLLVAADAAPGRRLILWATYGFGVALAVVTLVYLAAMVPVHAVVLAFRRAPRRTWIGWASASAAGALLASPVALEVIGQSGQVAWIPPVDHRVWRAITEYQWFVGAPAFAAAAAALVAAALLARRSPVSAVTVPVVALPWLLLPTIALVGYSLVGQPMYTPRYLLFTVPAAALLIGWALTRVTARAWVAGLGVAVLAALALPNYLAQRAPDAKPSGMDFSAVNRFAAEHMRPGDCVLFGKPGWNPASQRLVMNANPAAFDGVRDIGLGRTAASQGWLWDEERPITDLAEPLTSCTTLWYFTDRDRDQPYTIRHISNELWTVPPHRFEDAPEFGELTRAGLHIEQRWSFPVSQVVLLRR
ncbi:glycosyltransferase family 39 protein [Rhodococcus sp. NPDC003348]